MPPAPQEQQVPLEQGQLVQQVRPEQGQQEKQGQQAQLPRLLGMAVQVQLARHVMAPPQQHQQRL